MRGSAPGRSSGRRRARSTMSGSAGMGVDPLLVNAAQTDRPGRGWWRNLIDLYGAADILVAEVQFQRLYPGGPARAPLHRPPRARQRNRRRLHAHRAGQRCHPGDDGRRRAAHGRAVRRCARRRPAGARSDARHPCRRRRCREVVEDAPPTQVEPRNAIQVQIGGKRRQQSTISPWRICAPWRDRVRSSRSSINPGGTSYVLVTYHGDIAACAQRSRRRGWIVETARLRCVRMSSSRTSRRRSATAAAVQPQPPPPAQAPQPNQHARRCQ